MPAVSPLVGYYENRAHGGWHQHYYVDDGVHIRVVGDAEVLDEQTELRLHELLSGLDGLFDRMFAVIAAQPLPFSGLVMNQLQISGISFAGAHVEISFSTGLGPEGAMQPVVSLSDGQVVFSRWIG